MVSTAFLQSCAFQILSLPISKVFKTFMGKVAVFRTAVLVQQRTTWHCCDEQTVRGEQIKIGR